MDWFKHEVRILKPDEWGIKSDSYKIKTCNWCGNNYKLRVGEMEYIDNKQNFCCYNCRSKWRKMWDLRKKLIGIDFSLDGEAWTINCKKFDKWIKELEQIAQGYSDRASWVKLYNHTKKYACEDFLIDKRQLDYTKYVLDHWEMFDERWLEDMFLEILLMKTFDEPDSWTAETWTESIKERQEWKRWLY